MAILDLRGVRKAFGTGAGATQVLGGIDLTVEEGEFIAIVGFSGSGKTTLINTIAGLVTPDAGEVRVRGRLVDGPGPDRGLVFQSYSLMPWLTVRGNVAMAVDQVFQTESRAARAARVDRYVAMVGLAHAADRRPAELSGGMRQRVAVARALAMAPEILLLDEPLSALDALTRAKLQGEIERIWRQDRRTVVLITNDVDEAILLADRIIPLRPGPNAVLGPAFPVKLARPRDRAALNDDPAFIKLRSAVTQFLIDAGASRAGGENLPVSAPPKITPITVRPRTAPPQRSRTGMNEGPGAKRYLEFFRVGKTFPTPKGPLTVVDGFDLKVEKGEFISLIGHSGCGKSTVLSMAAGLVPITDGGIVLDGNEVTGAGPERAVVFQSPSLMPWLTARENVALGVDRVYPAASKAERADIVAHYLARVGLADAMDKPAAALSGGMRQRVGIARAFALSPKLLLLDEPFGMLDSLTRWELQDVLLDVWSRTRVTAICVTHDVDEAILLADRVVMMTNGPRAKIGRIMPVDLPRPRTRKALLDHPDYYRMREQVLSFLNDCEHGAAPGAGAPPHAGGPAVSPSAAPSPVPPAAPSRSATAAKGAAA